MAEKLRNPIILAGDPIDLEINKIELDSFKIFKKETPYTSEIDG